MNLSLVSWSLFRYPRASPTPVIKTSPGMPIPQSVVPFVINIFVLSIGFPIGMIFSFGLQSSYDTSILASHS